MVLSEVLAPNSTRISPIETMIPQGLKHVLDPARASRAACTTRVMRSPVGQEWKERTEYPG